MVARRFARFGLSVRMAVIIVASQPSFLFDLSHSDVANQAHYFVEH
jgi:hypothetical protein